MSGIKAIQTQYSGWNFRSRIEARWACFLNSLNMSFGYEVEGYHLSQGDTVMYLPDFIIRPPSPNPDYFLEIKGSRKQINDAALEKAKRLADLSGLKVYLLFGEVWSPDDGGEEESALLFEPGNDQIQYGYWWCICPVCSIIGLSVEGRADLLPCHCTKVPTYTFDDPKIINAYKTARKERFNG